MLPPQTYSYHTILFLTGWQIKKTKTKNKATAQTLGKQALMPKNQLTCAMFLGNLEPAYLLEQI